MKFENTDVWGFQHALRGMRNPKNSWEKSDSCLDDECRVPDFDGLCDDCEYFDGFGKTCLPLIGANDMKLAQTLIKAGSEHRKFMRQIIVSVDITAPLYWWKEFDTYKVGTVANSCSTMHKLHSAPITMDCFETGDFQSGVFPYAGVLIANLEHLRQRYIETQDKKYWKELVRWLPESWLQKRTVTMSYENLLAMCSKGQRRFHKLTEWSKDFIMWARSLPYAQEFIFGDELNTTEVSRND